MTRDRFHENQAYLIGLDLQYRSPEEFLGAPIDEQADVYSMGNNIYTLLTGLVSDKDKSWHHGALCATSLLFNLSTSYSKQWPFYEYNSYSVIQKKVLSLKRPYIDERFRNRNYVDGKLVEITERMWATNAKDRPTIFEVVDFLSEVKNVHTATIQQDKSKKGGKG